MTGRGQGVTHPSEGHNIKCVFSSVNGVQELWLRTVWVAIQLQLAHRIPSQVGNKHLGGAQPNAQVPLGKAGEEERKRQETPGDEEGITPLVAMMMHTGQILGV